MTDVKILSTGLAAGIIIDATVIRGVLAPALVALLGRFNWWLPAPVARLLRITRSPGRRGRAGASQPASRETSLTVAPGGTTARLVAV